MRLARIDAVRFGALEGSCLPEIGEGLTVVLGPNESGKSTYTALVRNVLFGFPVGRGKAGDRFYRSAGGERAGRLVFADEDGEWAIERVGEKKGGAVTVSALRGRERPELLAELLGDLTEQTYRVVFGFGLDELDDIENGDDKYLTARLFAAGTGLETNPLDVRAALDKEATDLFAPRARVATVNALVARMRDVRDEIRTLEAEASSFADEQARASRLAEELDPLRARRDEMDVRARGLERDAQRVRELAGEIEELDEAVAVLELAVADQTRLVADATVDERVLAVAAELGAALEEMSGFRRRLEAVRTAESGAADVAGRVEELGALPAGSADSAENRAKVEEWAARRASLEGELRAAERAAEAAEARAREFGASGGPAAATTRPPYIGWAVLALGVVFTAAGLFASQLLAVVLGVVVTAAGVVVLVARPRGVAGDLGADAARAAAEARASRGVAEGAASALAADGDAWRAWLADRSLDVYGDEPAAVRTLLDRLRSRDELEGQTARHQADAARERGEAESWAERVVALSRAFLDVPDTLALEDVAGIAARAKEAVGSARAAAEGRAKAEAALAAATADLRGARGRLEKRSGALEATLAPYGIEQDDAAERIETMAAEATERLSELRGQVEGRADELATLQGRLDAEGRDAAMAIARQRYEGLRARAAEEAQRHTVTALAVRLLDRARERFERERQPEVTRIAGRVFSEMTEGRYTDVRVPLDGSGIAVVTGEGRLKPSGELSRGTAEQLYLALRVGFLASLQSGRSLPVLMDDVVVDFDAQRRAGAAAAIAELAAGRQVIFFTCHEETATVLADAVPGRVLITLDRCAL